MANKSLLGKVPLTFSHLPTGMLIIGYPVYWLELYFARNNFGQTTPLALVLFLLLCVWVFWGPAKDVVPGWLKGEWKGSGLSSRIFLGSGAGIALGILLCALYAALLPPHLIQESDALNYHYTLPRQHLILNSFRHIPWSLADLYFLPVDFALAPYWLATPLPNKFPQFIFFMGFVGVAAKLTRIFSRNNLISMCLVIFAIVGSHHVGIQMGTAMLDVAMCYLFLAALDSFVEGHGRLCAVEFAFYFWSKSFIPIQMVIIILLMWMICAAAKKLGFKEIVWNIDDIWAGEQKKIYCTSLRKVLICFAFVSVFVGGPFVGKSLYYAQTPLFPFFPGRVPVVGNMDKNSVAWRSLVANAQKAVATRDQYGSSRSLVELLKHFWLIAVPEQGVNNRYDYPVGLMYLLCLGPFIYLLFKTIRKKQLAILPLFVCVYWALWWMGSHQTRFLFVPVIVMFIIVLSRREFDSKILMTCVLLAMGLTALSVMRAHREDFGKSACEVLRPKDRLLLEMSATVPRNRPVPLDFADAAFADFTVDVVNNDSVFVLKH